MGVLVSAIISDARLVHLGDEQNEQFEDSYLLSLFPHAYRRTIASVRQLGSRIVKRRTIARLPANVSTLLYPHSALLPDLGTSTITVSVRQDASFVAISSVSLSGGYPTYTTSTVHGRAVGDLVQVTGIVGLGNANLETVITATPTTSQLTLESIVTGTSMAGSVNPGVSFSRAGWMQLSESSHSSMPQEWQYEFVNQRYKFPVSTLDRQVMFEYWLEPSTRTFQLTDTVEEDRLRDVLASRVALLAGAKKIADFHYQSMSADHRELMRELRLGLVRDQQKQTYSRPVYQKAGKGARMGRI